MWETVRELDLGAHVRRWALPAPGGQDELLEVAEQLVAQPLVFSRPLWELHVIEGLEGGRTALLHKLHHCVGDGQLGLQLLTELLDGPARIERSRRGPTELARGDEADAGERAERARPGSGAATLERAALRLADGVDALLRLRRAARALLDAAAPTPALPWNAPLQARRRLGFTRLRLDAVERVRTACGATINDVALCVAGRRPAPASRLHRDLAAAPPGTGAREPARGAQRQASGQSHLGHVRAAPGRGSRRDLALDRRRAKITAQLKRQAAWEGVTLLLGALDALPAGLFAGSTRTLSLPRLAHLVASNVRGPADAVHLCGRRIAALYPLVPIAHQLGLAAAVLSYDGWLHFGLNSDAEHVPELPKLLRGIEESFEQLARTVGSQQV